MTLVLVVATTNPGKLAELQRLLGGEDVELRSLADHPEVPEIVEDGDTFEANARKKALAVARATGFATLADDSGLEVEALGGAPGVMSARWSGRGDRANNDKLLASLALHPGAPRTARFRSVLALAWPSGELEIATGSCEGEIAQAPRGSNGFGYDPLFVVRGEDGRTYAELEAHEKDRHSHRAAAFRALWPRVRDRLAR